MKRNLDRVLDPLYSYDVQNRLVSTGYQTAQYSYAPGNKRVWRGVWSSGALATDEITFWSITGQKLATYQLSVTGGVVNQSSSAPVLVATQTGTNYYFGRKLIKNASGYVGTDRLGSIGHFYPYGQEKPSATTNGTEKFTGYFRDAETGLDYADQRFHNPGTGRFLTPDPLHALHGGGATLNNPGTWNLYAYVIGDPVNSTDRRGLSADCDGDTDDCEFGDDGDCTDVASCDGTNDGGGGCGCNSFTSGDITGYDADGNPIIGDPTLTNEQNSVNVTDTFDYLPGWMIQTGLFLPPGWTPSMLPGGIDGLPPPPCNPGAFVYLGGGQKIGGLSISGYVLPIDYQWGKGFSYGGIVEVKIPGTPIAIGREVTKNWTTGNTSSGTIGFAEKNLGGGSWGPVSGGVLGDTHGNVGLFGGLAWFGGGAYMNLLNCQN